MHPPVQKLSAEESTVKSTERLGSSGDTALEERSPIKRALREHFRSYEGLLEQRKDIPRGNDL